MDALLLPRIHLSGHPLNQNLHCQIFHFFDAHCQKQCPSLEVKFSGEKVKPEEVCQSEDWYSECPKAFWASEGQVTFLFVSLLLLQCCCDFELKVFTGAALQSTVIGWRSHKFGRQESQWKDGSLHECGRPGVSRGQESFKTFLQKETLGSF